MCSPSSRASIARGFGGAAGSGTSCSSTDDGGEVLTDFDYELAV
jgi:hypothetical protein